MSLAHVTAVSSWTVEELSEESHDPSNALLDLKLKETLSLEDLLKNNIPTSVDQWHISFVNGFVFKYPELSLRVHAGSQHRSHGLQHSIENHELPRLVVDSLRRSLRELVFNSCGTVSLNCFDFTMLVLQLLEETADFLLVYRKSKSGAQELEDHRTPIYRLPNAAPDTAYYWLGKTTKEICNNILPDYRIVHVESIMRSDLSRRFRAIQDHMRYVLSHQSLTTLKRHIPQDYRRNKSGNSLQLEDAVEYLVKPRITFHGTKREVVGSVVQYGFLKPGDAHPATGVPLKVRCGNTYGRGIYTSPDPSFSLMYSSDAEKSTNSTLPGLKLIVCATLMGRVAQMSREDDWREMSEPYPGSDSHVGNDGQEYIVFNSGQVLPCYILHIDWRRDDDPMQFLAQQLNSTQKNKLHPKLNKEILYPGDMKRMKQERMAQGSKFFAYGFGPVAGKSIVIEEVGDVDDDEEDYGDYQQNRVEGKTENADLWMWDDNERYPNVDEYTAARCSKRKN
ncbi:hypothetical protein MMC11_008439 [Xylographa trunciseda]|nr:hypothetical protein [Xylographa trunciseda]